MTDRERGTQEGMLNMYNDGSWDLNDWIDSPLFPLIGFVIFYFTILGLLSWLASRPSQNSWGVRESEDTRSKKDD